MIVENQLKDDKQIDPQRKITHVGMDELSLKKRHKLYVTVMTDLTAKIARVRGPTPGISDSNSVSQRSWAA